MPIGPDTDRQGSSPRGDRNYDYSHLNIPAGGKSMTLRNYLKDWSDLSEDGYDVGVEWENGAVDPIQTVSRSAIDSLLNDQSANLQDTIRLLPEPEMRETGIDKGEY